MLFYPQNNDDKPSVKKIIIYSVAIFVLLVLLGYFGTKFGWQAFTKKIKGGIKIKQNTVGKKIFVILIPLAALILFVLKNPFLLIIYFIFIKKVKQKYY